MKELKCCPFCGGEAEIIEAEEMRMVMVSCKNCGASSEILNSNEEAAEAWNKRA